MAERGRGGIQGPICVVKEESCSQKACEAWKRKKKVGANLSEVQRAGKCLAKSNRGCGKAVCA